ncbi:UDP glcNAc:betaGal beta 1 [Echinococcus multilocularis]|uniref:Hexosyltransferase n=1 Tax=Echinococcus multilocularis TaxID=6211 RepID=A0A068Y7J5_ECHMU|nr:UDP glcNAc:betaGal beta 1 [Echinococcus multilocularis]
MGLPRQHGGKVFSREGHTITLKGWIGELAEYFDGKTTQTMEYVLHEMAHYVDILLADYEDTYFNLTWKTVTNLRWLSAFCGQRNGDVFLVMDDDYKVNFTYLETILKTLPPEVKRRSIFGTTGKRDAAYRKADGKRYLLYREFAQLFGAELIDDLTIGSAYTRYNYAPEDVYLGMLALKLGIQLRNMNEMYDHFDFKRRHKNRQPVLIALKRYFDALVTLP